MLQRLFSLVVFTALASTSFAQTASASLRKEAMLVGELHALTWDMGTYYQSEDTAKAHRVIAADIKKFEDNIAALKGYSPSGSAKTSLFIVEKIWEAYKRILLSPATESNLKLAQAQTTQLMSACEYARTTFDRDGLTAVN